MPIKKLGSLVLFSSLLISGTQISLSSASVRFPGRVDHVPVTVGSGDAEATLRISYSVHCTPQNGYFPGLTGGVQFQGRTIRFDLFEAIHERELMLGRPSIGGMVADISIDPSSGCTLDDVHFEVLNFSDDVVLRHAPFQVVRNDQYLNRVTDLPLIIGYSTESLPNEHLLIRYVIYYSDEDSSNSVGAEEGHMGKYGRRSDIEWLYEVELDKTLLPVHRIYHGGYLFGIGHAAFEFHGSFVEGTEHPILYDRANHNVFSDEPEGDQKHRPLAGYQWVPSERLVAPEPREAVMWRNPWMYQVSDLELEREGKLFLPSNDYLYVLFDGKIDWGSIRGRLDLTSGESFVSGGGNSSFDALGEDMWSGEGYMAIPIRSEVSVQPIQLAADTFHGEFWFRKASLRKPKVMINSLKFFKLNEANRSFTPVDISNSFVCEIAGLDTRCVF